jgi:hypothetical protein
VGVGGWTRVWLYYMYIFNYGGPRSYSTALGWLRDQFATEPVALLCLNESTGCIRITFIFLCGSGSKIVHYMPVMKITFNVLGGTGSHGAKRHLVYGI